MTRSSSITLTLIGIFLLFFGSYLLTSYKVSEPRLYIVNQYTTTEVRGFSSLDRCSEAAQTFNLIMDEYGGIALCGMIQ